MPQPSFAGPLAVAHPPQFNRPEFLVGAGSAPPGRSNCTVAPRSEVRNLTALSSSWYLL